MKINDDFTKLKALLNDDGFQEYVEIFREGHGPYSAESWAEVIIGAFTLKSWLAPVVAYYLESGEISENLVSPPVLIEYDDDRALVKLVLAPDITQPALKEWIDINWSKQIKPHLDILPEQRQVVPNTVRDNMIYEDYLNKSKNGRSFRVADIAADHEVHPSTVYRVISRKKKYSK